MVKPLVQAANARFSIMQSFAAGLKPRQVPLGFLAATDHFLENRVQTILGLLDDSELGLSSRPLSVATMLASFSRSSGDQASSGRCKSFWIRVGMPGLLSGLRSLTAGRDCERQRSASPVPIRRGAVRLNDSRRKC